MHATAVRPHITVTYPVHPALVDHHDVHGLLGEILDDGLDDYLNLREAAYAHYRAAGHGHVVADMWAHDAAAPILPAGATVSRDGL